MGTRTVASPDAVWRAVRRLRDEPGRPRLRRNLAQRYWNWLLHPRSRGRVVGITFRAAGDGDEFTYQCGTEPRDATYSPFAPSELVWPTWESFVPSWADNYNSDMSDMSHPQGPLSGLDQFTAYSVDTIKFRYPRRDIDVNWDMNGGTWFGEPDNEELYTSVWTELWAHELLELISLGERPRWRRSFMDDGFVEGFTYHRWGSEGQRDAETFSKKRPYTTHPLWPHYNWALKGRTDPKCELTVVFDSGCQYRGWDALTGI